jgi:hypothetical protein
VDSDDQQAIHRIRYFTGELLTYSSVLPAEVIEMLRCFALELLDADKGRWEGIGGQAQSEWMADRMMRAISDGEWVPGERADDKEKWYLRVEKRETHRRAIQALTAKGVLTESQGRYYAKICNYYP